MNLNEFQQAAMRTSGSGHDRLKNGALGLIGETGEIVDIIKKYLFQSGSRPALPVEKLKMECGDVLWYIAESCTGVGAAMQSVLEHIRSFGQAGMDMEECAISMMENALDVYRYQQIPNCKLPILRKLGNLYLHLVMLCSYLNLTINDVAQANIDKLYQRYPHGFEPDRSLHRDRYEQKGDEAYVGSTDDRD